MHRMHRGIKRGGVLVGTVILIAMIGMSPPATVRADDGVKPGPFGTPAPALTLSTQVRVLLEHAHAQRQVTKIYDPSYVVLAYPNGDVSPERGVCTDVLIRAMRATGIDLQKEVHEDMAENFSAYPQVWGMARPDTSIDHRRVLNLRVFFTRKGKSVLISAAAADYLPGDFVSWSLNAKGTPHIGIVSDIWNSTTGRYEIIHNICCGAELEDVLFDWEITGHFRYY